MFFENIRSAINKIRQTAINKTATGRAYCNPNELNRSKIITGVVIGWYAIIITAPNSLIPRAHIISNPESTGLQAKGKDTVKKTRKGEAPKFIAAFSSLTGTALKPSMALVIKNGTLTKAMASIIPAVLLTNPNPMLSAILPGSVFRESTDSNAIPAAEWGITIGRFIIPIINFFKKNSLRANTYAKGIQAMAKIKVPIIDTQMVSQILSRTSASPIVSDISLPEVDKNIPSKGAIINNSTKPPKKLKTRMSLLFFTYLFFANCFNESGMLLYVGEYDGIREGCPLASIILIPLFFSRKNFTKAIAAFKFGAFLGMVIP